MFNFFENKCFNSAVSTNVRKNKRTEIPTQENLERYDSSDFVFLKRLGSGAYGDVYLANWLSKKMKVAIKEMAMDDTELNVYDRLARLSIV